MPRPSAGSHHNDKLHVKKGDNVIVLSGKHKGQTGKVLCVIHEAGNIGLEQRCSGASTGLGSEVEMLLPILAPIGGIVVRKNVVEGQYVAEGEAMDVTQRLQERGVYPTQYRGTTLRDHLGLLAARRGSPIVQLSA